MRVFALEVFSPMTGLGLERCRDFVVQVWGRLQCFHSTCDSSVPWEARPFAPAPPHPRLEKIHLKLAGVSMQIFVTIMATVIRISY